MFARLHGLEVSPLPNRRLGLGRPLLGVGVTGEGGALRGVAFQSDLDLITGLAVVVGALDDGRHGSPPGGSIPDRVAGCGGGL